MIYHQSHIRFDAGGAERKDDSWFQARHQAERRAERAQNCREVQWNLADRRSRGRGQRGCSACIKIKSSQVASLVRKCSVATPHGVAALFRNCDFPPRRSRRGAKQPIDALTDYRPLDGCRRRCPGPIEDDLEQGALGVRGQHAQRVSLGTFRPPKPIRMIEVDAFASRRGSVCEIDGAAQHVPTSHCSCADDSFKELGSGIRARLDARGRPSQRRASQPGVNIRVWRAQRTRPSAVRTHASDAPASATSSSALRRRIQSLCKSPSRFTAPAATTCARNVPAPATPGEVVWGAPAARVAINPASPNRCNRSGAGNSAIASRATGVTVSRRRRVRPSKRMSTVLSTPSSSIL